MNNQQPITNQELLKIIHDRINASADKKISFADYMDVALYHPKYGYYSSGEVGIGKDGDFFTSSSLGVDFGELLAEQFVEMWQIMDCPRHFTLLEMGAGQGQLASDILNYLEQNYLDLFKLLDYIIIEKSPKLIEKQTENLVKFNSKIKIKWKNWEEIADNSLIGCCFSNELIDAFPVHQLVIESKKLQEIYVTDNGKQLKEITGELSTTKIQDYLQLIEIELTSEAYDNGYRTEVNLAALNWLENIARRLQKGYLVTIDYGYDARRYYHPQRREGTLQCYYQHRRHNDPYINIGYQDITAHVDFTAIERWGELCGLEKIGFTQQGIFLMALGLGDRLNELSSGNFNFQQIIQRRDALHQLIDPVGLGGFGVLIQSKGLDLEKAKNLKGLQVPI
jgi:SAM-dependent MidA family methyltransferase